MREIAPVKARSNRIENSPSVSLAVASIQAAGFFIRLLRCAHVVGRRRSAIRFCVALAQLAKKVAEQAVSRSAVYEFARGGESGRRQRTGQGERNECGAMRHCLSSFSSSAAATLTSLKMAQGIEIENKDI
ncbi:MAG: hypothetical protein FD139_2785 [Methylocystaceae bacterium]|nr:MAG: hypothetical protein FD139_2785 [Methylocystaceae bacterium]